MRPSAPLSVRFTKYDEAGAYHWIEADRRARRYNPALDARYRVVASAFGRAVRALDVGCGDGYLMHLLSRRCRAVVGIDGEWTGAALAAKKLNSLGNCVVVRASCYELPFADGAFDVVVMTDVIEHLETPACALAEVRRVLQRGGRLLVTTPKWRPDRVWDPHHVREYTPAELRTDLEEHFQDVTLTYFWPLVWSNLYATKLGWRLVRALARRVYNPFLAEGSVPDNYGQILAVCR
jgi:SAM-dependent methyltransferase